MVKKAKKEDMNSKEKLDKKLTPGEKKLLASVLRRKSVKVRERLQGHGKKFKIELKKALFTAFIAAFGFLIALEWREAIQAYVRGVVGASPVQGQLFSAVIVTIVAVIGIIITTKFFSEEG